MSRTEKDKKPQVRYGDDVFTMDVPDQRKKKREYDVVFPGQTAPGWWVRQEMNRPHRRECHQWEREVLISDIDEVDPPVEAPKKYHN